MLHVEVVFEGAVCVQSAELDLGHGVQRVWRRDLSGQRQPSHHLLVVFLHLVLEHRSDGLHRVGDLHGGAVCVTNAEFDEEHGVQPVWSWGLYIWFQSSSVM